MKGWLYLYIVTGCLLTPPLLLLLLYLYWCCYCQTVATAAADVEVQATLLQFGEAVLYTQSMRRTGGVPSTQLAAVVRSGFEIAQFFCYRKQNLSGGGAGSRLPESRAFTAAVVVGYPPPSRTPQGLPLCPQSRVMRTLYPSKVGISCRAVVWWLVGSCAFILLSSWTQPS